MNWKLINGILSCLLLIFAAISIFAGKATDATYYSVMAFYFKYEADREE